VKLNDIARSQDIAQAGNLNCLPQQTQAISTTADCHENAAVDAVRETRDAFSSIEQKLGRLPNAFGDRTNAILSLLRALQTQVSGLDTQRASGAHSLAILTKNSEAETGSTSFHLSPKVEESIARVRQLANKGDITIRDEGATVLLSDLSLILKTFSTLPLIPPPEAEEARKHKRSIDEQEEQSHTGHLKRLRTLVKVAESLTVNKEGK
jgi:hypothetical protein